ncbi:MAG: peptidoglycan-binding protein, partial [Candidatus Aureabacteria bacterium]|nr:peptidoglycan-binding protein [Candidatus Auribacterota bacterium]
TYYRGDSDEEVVKLKKILKANGYFLSSDNSFFDMDCEEAVRNFQSGFLLYPDGTVGTETILMLYSRFVQNVPRLHEK